MRRSIPAAAAAAVLAALVAVACGTNASPIPTPRDAASGSDSPDASASGAAGASPTRGPRPTAWPGNAVLGIEALGAADNEIRQAIADFAAGVANEDLALMRRAAVGLAGVDVLLPNADRIAIFEPMRLMAERYREVLPRIAAAAARVRDAIDAGDADGIATASRELTAALTEYAEIQPELAAWVEQSIEQRRLLLR